MTVGYALCYQLCGPTPSGFHAFNIALHAMIVCIVFVVTKRISGAKIASAASILFALHPIHTEPVAWVAAVTDLEVTFFVLITFWLYLDLERSATKWHAWKSFAMSGCFGLALASKEQALVLPILALIYEHCYRSDRARTTSAEKLGRYGPLWLLMLLYIPVRIQCLGAFAPDVKQPEMTAYQLFLSALTLLGQYCGKLLCPVHLSAFYMFQKSVSALEVGVLCGAIGCIVALALAWILRTRAPVASFGIVWMFVTLVPVLNARWLGTNVFAERYAYLPSIGFCWLAGFIIQHLLGLARQARHPAWQIGFISVMSVVALSCVVRIVTRNRDWNNNVVFYSRTLAGLPIVPATNELRLDLAVEYTRKHDMANAERELRIIINSEPNNIYALSTLGVVLIGQARPVEAMETLLQVVSLSPNYAGGHLNLGLSYMHLNMLDQAEQELRTGIALAPGNSGGYVNLAVIYQKRGRFAAAERALERALWLDPRNVAAVQDVRSMRK